MTITLNSLSGKPVNSLSDKYLHFHRTSFWGFILFFHREHTFCLLVLFNLLCSYELSKITSPKLEGESVYGRASDVDRPCWLQLKRAPAEGAVQELP